MTTDDTVMPRIAALKAMTTPELRHQWQLFFEGPLPRFNRRFLESRLAYRLQEVVFGGLKPAMVARLEALGQQLDAGDVAVRRRRADERPICGTRLIREYQGVAHHVTVLHGGYEWEGRLYKSLSAIARAITGTRWNGPHFFGLRSPRRARP